MSRCINCHADYVICVCAECFKAVRVDLLSATQKIYELNHAADRADEAIRISRAWQRDDSHDEADICARDILAHPSPPPPDRVPERVEAVLEQYLTLAIEHMNTDDRAEEDRLADLMDPIWNTLTEAQRSLMRKYNMAFSRASAPPTDASGGVMEVIRERDRLYCESIIATMDSSGKRLVCDVENMLHHFNTRRPDGTPELTRAAPTEVTWYERTKLILPDVVGVLPLLKCISVFGEFDGIEYEGGTLDLAIANAIGTLTEFEELLSRIPAGAGEK